MCKYGNPRDIGYIFDFKLEDRKPSACEINLVSFYKNTDKCPSKLFGKFLEKNNKPPVAVRTFSHESQEYNYPLELLHIIPRTNDAGRYGKALAKRVMPKPSKRFEKINDIYKDYFKCINDANFALIPLEFIEINEDHIGYKKFDEPKYRIRQITEKEGINFINTEHPFYELRDEKTDFYYRIENFDMIRFHVIYSDKKPEEFYLNPLIPKNKEEITDFMTFAKIKIDFNDNYINVNDEQRINNLIDNFSPDENNFVILIYNNLDNQMKDLIRNLMMKDIPHQSIRYKTLKSGSDDPFHNSIFNQITNKIGCLTWAIELNCKQNPNVIGISMKYSKDRIYSSILCYEHDGLFKSGVFINESKSNFLSVFMDKLSMLTEDLDQIILLLNCQLNKDMENEIHRLLNKKKYAIYEVFSNSLIRLYRLDANGNISDRGVSAGYGLVADEFCNIVSHEYTIQGTQICIKTRKKFVNFVDKSEFYELIYKLSQYNPSLTRNSTKLPYPLHSSSKTIKKCTQMKCDTFSFSKPFYF